MKHCEAKHFRHMRTTHRRLSVTRFECRCFPHTAHRNHEHDVDVDPPSEQKQKVWEHCLCTVPLHWARIYPMFAGELQRSRRCIASKKLD
jgi:hypothetical protein